MKGYNKIDAIEFNDNGEMIKVKGHIEPIKVSFKHDFSDRTLKVMFWEQFNDSDKDFYCGG